jgi:hypothetical protein
MTDLWVDSIFQAPAFFALKLRELKKAECYGRRKFALSNAKYSIRKT